MIDFLLENLLTYYYVQTKDELNSLVKELKLILYGDDDSEPCEQACAQLTEEFFREDTMRLLIIFLPKLNLEVHILTITLICIYGFCSFTLIYDLFFKKRLLCDRPVKMQPKLLQVCKGNPCHHVSKLPNI